MFSKSILRDDCGNSPLPKRPMAKNQFFSVTLMLLAGVLGASLLTSLDAQLLRTSDTFEKSVDGSDKESAGDVPSITEESAMPLPRAIETETQVTLPETDNETVGRPTGTASDFVQGDVIVQFRTRALAEAIVRGGASKSPELANVLTLMSINNVIEKTFIFPDVITDGELNRYVLFKAPGLSKEETSIFVAMLASDSTVTSAETNSIILPAFIPNDTYYGTTGAWGQDQWDLWGLEKLQMEPAWDITKGAGVLVAVVDTGIDFTHPELAGNTWVNPGESGPLSGNGIDDDGNGYVDDYRGWDFGNNDNDPTDDYGHGTHVAGTIAALGNNASGVIGVAYEAKIMSVKVFEQGSATNEQLAQGIVYAAANNAKVSNLSFGGCCGRSKVMEDAINYSHDTKNQVVVVASGNASNYVGSPEYGFYPANVRKAITVGAVDNYDQRVYFSNIGVKLDVAAPGGGFQIDLHNILSLKTSGTNVFYPSLFVGSNYLRLSGTSMAAPHVSGVAALVLAQHPEFTPEQVRQTLRRGALNILAAGFDWETGYGLVNAPGALAITQPMEAFITAPTSEWIGGQGIQIRGYAGGTGFVKWQLQYGPGNFPTSSQWQNITGFQTNQVSDGLLTTWSPNIPVGKYTIRLRVWNAANQIFEDRVSVYIDKDLHPGWPKRGVYFYPFNYNFSTNGGVTAADINRDGKDEVLFSDGLKLNVYQSDGTNLPGWPKTANNWSSDTFFAGPAVGTLPDKSKIIVTANEGKEAYGNTPAILSKIYAWHANGTPLAGWPKSLPINTFATNNITVDDINGDGSPEIIVSAYTGITGFPELAKVWAWDTSGNVLPGWPKDLPNMKDPGPVLTAKFTTSSEKYLVVAANDGGGIVYVLKHDGTVLPGWPKFIQNNSQYFYQNPALGDITGDGIPEILIGSRNASGLITYMNAFKVNGSQLPGWPKSITGGQVRGTVIADVNTDGVNDVVAVNFDNQNNVNLQRVYAWKGNGELLAGWPVTTNNINPFDGYNLPPIIANFDDGLTKQIVLPVKLFGVGNSFSLRGFNSTGQPVSSLIRYFFGQSIGYQSLNDPNPVQVNSAAVGDMDGDGLLELALIDEENFVYLWDLPGSVKGLCSSWPMYLHDPGHTGFAPKPSKCLTNSIEEYSNEPSLPQP